MTLPTRVLAVTAAAVSIASILASDLRAFGDSGHRVVGTLAELHLKNTNALKQVRKILRPNETLAEAAVWHDTIKDPVYEDGDTPIFRLNHPAQDTYHYANLPFQATQYQPDAPGARSTDVVQTAMECIRVLRTGAGRFSQREALRFLAHATGDIHQPLHVANGFVSSAGPPQFVVPQGPSGWRTTLGGNALVYGPENRFNLHSYWDTHAVNITMGSDDVPTYASRLLSEVTPAGTWTNSGNVEGWPVQWANEGLALGKDVHKGIQLLSYLGPDEAKRTLHRWQIQQPPDYDSRARPVIRQQLAVAGFRLAATLKQIWP